MAMRSLVRPECSSGPCARHNGVGQESSQVGYESTAGQSAADKAHPSLQILNDTGPSYTAQMSVAEWAALPDHPRGRDAELQARKAHWDLARTACGAVAERQRRVEAAEFEGRVYKVDGHARALLWNTGQLPDPGTVFATVYRCRNRDELNALYATYDTQDAAVTMYDRVTGAYREQGLLLRSRRLRRGAIADALGIAMRGVARGEDAEGGTMEDFDVYEAVRLFSPELRLLDTVDPQPETFHTGIVSAALLSLSLEPATLEFFNQLSQAGGNMKDGLLDPVQGMLRILGKIKEKGTGRIKLRQEQLCATTLGAIELWQKGETAPGFWSKGRYEPVHLLKVVRKVRELKQASLSSP